MHLDGHDSNVIQIAREGDVTVVLLSNAAKGGILEADAISEQLHQYIEENQPQKLVIDFSEVRFLSSQMLGLLVSIWRKMQELDGTMVISGINPQLNRVFRITNLDRIFQFSPDKAGAVSQLRSGHEQPK